jgi:hypothetical protein
MGYTDVAMKKIFTTVCFASFVFWTAQSWSFSDPYQVYRSGRWDLAIDSQFYKTTANFDSGGEKVDLPFENSYQLIDITPQLRWGMTRNLGVRVGGNVGNAESVDPINTRANSTFNRIDVGADYLLINYPGFQTILDFEYSHPFQTFDANTDDALNSNGAYEAKPTAILRMDSGSFYPFGYVGANLRGEGLSTLLTYGLGGEFRFSELGIGASLDGFSSVTDDEFTDQASRRNNVTSRVNAGSKKFYSVNPNSLAAELFLNFSMTESTRFKFYGGADITGSNTSQGFFAGAALTFALDEGAPERVPKPSRTQKNKKVKVENGFSEDTEDGVDQNYFKPIETKDEQYIQPVEEENSEEKPLVPKTSYDEEQEEQNGTVDPATQNDLDQLGYTIKLKNEKRKKSSHNSNQKPKMELGLAFLIALIKK